MNVPFINPASIFIVKSNTKLIHFLVHIDFHFSLRRNNKKKIDSDCKGAKEYLPDRERKISMI